MDEYDYIGFFEGEKYVCTHHFEDRYLNQYIQENGENGECSYCHRKGTVLDMSKLEEHVGAVISTCYNDVDSENLPLASSFFLDKDDDDETHIKHAGCFAVPAGVEVFEDTSEMMDALGLHTECNELNNDIDSFYRDNMWVKSDPFEPWWNEMKEWQWKKFSEKVKHTQRYTFLADIYDEDNEILNDLYVVLRESKDIYRRLPVGVILYRTRSLQHEPDGNFGFDDITSAPDEFAGQCRMSPAGVSMFYGAFDRDTAIEESIKNENEKVVVVGEFLTTTGLYVLDLTRLPERVSVWMDNWQWHSFLKSFHDDITKPLGQNTREAIDYVPSQVFTEFLRWMFKDKEGNKINGLVYRSSKTGLSNVVLFCDNAESRKWLKLKSFSVSVWDRSVD